MVSLFDFRKTFENSEGYPAVMWRYGVSFRGLNLSSFLLAGDIADILEIFSKAGKWGNGRLKEIVTIEIRVRHGAPGDFRLLKPSRDRSVRQSCLSSR